MKKKSIFAVVCVLILAGCSFPSKQTATPTSEVIDTEASATPVVPTSIPYAIKLGELGFTTEEYQAELSRYQKAYPEPSPADAKATVLASLTDELYLAKAGNENGFSLTTAELDQKINELKSSMGGDDTFNTWLNGQGYTTETFRKSFELSAAAAYMRDKLAEQTPQNAQQVHAQQILFLDQAEANNVLSQIKAGSDFATLAEEYDPLTKGDLGWFPKGYLTQKSVEDAAFSLAVGQISEVITSEAGYHILKVLESADAHPLSPGAYQMMQSNSIEQWLQEQRQTNQVEINLP